MKAGTAQKLVLNMITTATMIQLEKVKGNKMVDMQLSNNKLVNRGIKMVMNELDISETEAKNLLDKHQSVRASVNAYRSGNKKTNKDILVKGLKKMAISLIMMFAGPTLFYIATTNKEKPLYIPLLIISFLICAGAIFFAFKGLQTIMNSMFDNNKPS